MKKILIISFLFIFGLSLPTQAVFIPESAKKKKTDNHQFQGDVNSNTEEARKKFFQKDKENVAVEEEKSSSAPGELRRSQIADAVRNLLQLADQNENIGQQIRTIAINQNKNQEKLETDLEEIQQRSRWAKFFIGAKYREINEVKARIEQNISQIQDLSHLKEQIDSSTDQQRLMEQVQMLRQNNEEMQKIVSEAEKGFSLFGWLFKLLS